MNLDLNASPTVSGMDKGNINIDIIFFYVIYLNSEEYSFDNNYNCTITYCVNVYLKLYLMIIKHLLMFNMFQY